MGVAQALFSKMKQTEDRVKVVEAKVDDGFGEIDEKMQDIWTLTDVRFTGLENGRARIYGEMNHIKDDVVYIHGDVGIVLGKVANVADDVAMVAHLVHEVKQRQLVWNIAFFIMLGIIMYLVWLPVTVCPLSFPMGPNHTEPVDVYKNATNTIIGGLRCLTDKILPKPCRDGYTCKRDTYPDW